MACLQTAINWGRLVCHRRPISCSLLSLPETEVAGRCRGSSLEGASAAKAQLDIHYRAPFDTVTKQARQNMIKAIRTHTMNVGVGGLHWIQTLCQYIHRHSKSIGTASLLFLLQTVNIWDWDFQIFFSHQ